MSEKSTKELIVYSCLKAIYETSLQFMEGRKPEQRPIDALALICSNSYFALEQLKETNRENVR